MRRKTLQKKGGKYKYLYNNIISSNRIELQTNSTIDFILFYTKTICMGLLDILK